MQFPVTVVKGKEKAQVVHSIDLDGWVKDGWKVDGEEPEYDREALKVEATELGLEFSDKIGNKKLFELIEAKKAELNA